MIWYAVIIYIYIERERERAGARPSHYKTYDSIVFVNCLHTGSSTQRCFRRLEALGLWKQTLSVYICIYIYIYIHIYIYTHING